MALDMLEMTVGDTELDRLRGIASRLTARVVELRARLGEPLMVEQDLEDAESAGGALAAFMEALQRSAPVGLACLDRDLRFTRVNDALAEMTGCPSTTTSDGPSPRSSLRSGLSSSFTVPPIHNPTMARHADVIGLLEPVRPLRTAMAMAMAMAMDEHSNTHHVSKVFKLAHPLIATRSVP